MAVTIIGEDDIDPAFDKIKEIVLKNYKRDDFIWIIVGEHFEQVSELTELLSYEHWDLPQEVTIDNRRTYINVISP